MTGTVPVEVPVRVPPVTLSEIGPLALSTRLAKVATPALAIIEVVPLKLPLEPVPTARATGPLYDVSTFPNGSSASRVKLNGTPAVMAPGGWLMTRWVAAAGMTVLGADITGGKLGAANWSVSWPAVSFSTSLKDATPATTLAVIVPVSDPPPLACETVTTVELSVVSMLPN